MWARKNPNLEMSFLDVFHFRSCFLPYFMFMMILLSGYDATLDLLGMIAGHVYYFCEDVVPKVPETRNMRLFKAPEWLTRLCVALRLNEFGQDGANVGIFGGLWDGDEVRDELEQ